MIVIIAACSNLPMAEAIRLYRRGEYPEHNLYGALALEEAGHNVRYLAPSSSSLQRAGQLARGRLGDLDQALLALKCRPAVIYAGSESTVLALSLLRYCRALSRHVVAIYHSPPTSQVLAKLATRGYDLAFTLSQIARHRLLALGRDPATTIVLRWGPQLDFPAYRPTGAEHVVSCGKSGRDLDLLAGALDGHPATIYAPHSWRSPSDTIVVRRFSEVQFYPEVLADVARASVVAIPFADTRRMLGLSELNDALALSKPIVMTRSPHIDVDIEAVGCGIWVNPGDANGWRQALGYLRNNPEVARDMGMRGRTFAEREWNSAICNEQIVTALDRMR